MVTLEVIALSGEDRRIDIRASIGAPQRQEDGSWVCRVEVAPLQDQALDVRGVDSFHAVWLGCSLILKLLAQLKEAGTRLQNADGSDFPLEAYLAGLDGKR
ncbi:MAG TPA: hypothetical protein VGJ74_11400 [Burkholderiales bacterium]